MATKAASPAGIPSRKSNRKAQQVHRPNHRPLRKDERANFARGLLKLWGPRDNVTTMAQRFNTSEGRVLEAVRDHIQAVGDLWAEGGNSADDIAREIVVPQNFALYGIRSAARNRDTRREKVAK